MFIMPSSLPCGHYLTEFVGMWLDNAPNGDVAARFTFRVAAGDHADETVDVIAPAQFKPGTALSLLATSLAGSPFGPGSHFAPDAYVGRPYVVVVTETRGGRLEPTNVIAIAQ